PEDAGAAIRAEMKADLEPAVGDPAVGLVLAFDLQLVFAPAAAVMNDGTGTALAGLAMADINAFRFTGRDRSQLSAMALGGPVHLVLPITASPFRHSRPRDRGCRARLIHLQPRRRVRS